MTARAILGFAGLALSGLHMRGRIFEDDSYRVTAHLAEGGAGKPFVISFSAFSKRHDAVEARAFKQGFGVDAVLSLGLNCLSFTTNKNDWYQGKSATQAIEAINAYIPEGSRVITYGSSMGGFAAINFSEQLHADYFLAISPQASIGADFFASIGEKRWGYESSVLELNQDHIVNGVPKSRHGAIIYDDRLRLDAAHTLTCTKNSVALLIPIPFSGHLSGLAANRHYGLKRMLAEIANDSFDAVVAAAVIFSGIRNTLDFLASDVSTAEAFAERLLKNPDELNLQTVIILIESLKGSDAQFSPVVLGLYSSILKSSKPLFAGNLDRYRNLKRIMDAAIQKHTGESPLA